MKILLVSAAGVAAIVCSPGFSQTPCSGTAVSGTVRDSTQALVPGAMISLDGGVNQVGGADGRFRFPCVAAGSHHLAASATGFASRSVAMLAPQIGPTDVVLVPEVVTRDIEVNGADAGAAVSATASGPTQTISGSQLQALADDPDDLLRELQQLAAAAGGNAANVTISVDGFQGSSKLPPKSAIAYIKVNPDQFSAEFREPPFDGARVEVYTRPGLPTYHGAIFLTNGSPWENARDPFSASKAALGKQRYGFELTGPASKNSDFALTLEHRSIDNFAVVDAVTLDASGNAVPSAANVATPQRLWLGTARLDSQLGQKNTFITSYSANVNNLENVGVGGTTLGESGYGSEQYEHMLRFSDVTTISPRAMHEGRLSLRWDGENDTPSSTAPQVQVAGAFTGGGTSIGAQQLHELDIEADDDLILTPRNHSIKFGTQFRLPIERLQLTTYFNGTYIFGGGTAPVLDASGNPLSGQTATISGLEQYRRALLKLPGGTPTAFSGVAGSPTVNFTQVRDALFFEDDWNAGHGLHIAYGLRYFLENNPTAIGAITPRLGVLWSPDKKGTWTLHAHGGLFSGRFNQSTTQEVLREDGVQRVSSIFYNPVYGNPLAGSTPIHFVRQFAPHISNLTWGGWNVGGTRSLPGGWNINADYYKGRMWNDTRSVNINSPLNGLPNGPRPGPANVNILQLNNSGQGRISATFVGIEQHAVKHVQLFFGGVRVELVDDTDDNEFATPQSAYSDAGEFAKRSGQQTWNLFGNATFTLPEKIQLSGNFNAGGDAHYNITTGLDNNGDGDFNDRPRYAAAGTPSAIQTQYGLLTANGGTGVFPRNRGQLPWTFYLDSNLQRAFVLARVKNAVHEQTVTVNLRSSNLLNHPNVTQVGGVLGSPLFGVPYAADNGRRVEAGLRYSF